MDEKITKHPSFGVIQLNRTTGATRLFGSSVDHLSYISLTISRAELHRDQHAEHFYPTEDVVRVELSPATRMRWICLLSSTPPTMR